MITTEQITEKIRSLPKWTRPFVGLAFITIAVVTVPIWVPIVLGSVMFDLFFRRWRREMNIIQVSDEEIFCALVEQVSKAVPKGGSEQDVRTIITRPMWNSFCRAVEIPENSIPTDHIGIKSIRVYGSETIVVESEKMAACSFAVGGFVK